MDINLEETEIHPDLSGIRSNLSEIQSDLSGIRSALCGIQPYLPIKRSNPPVIQAVARLFHYYLSVFIYHLLSLTSPRCRINDSSKENGIEEQFTAA